MKKKKMKVSDLISFDYNTNFSPKNMGIGLKDGFVTTPMGVRISQDCLNLVGKVKDGGQLRRPLQKHLRSTEKIYQVFMNH